MSPDSAADQGHSVIEKPDDLDEEVAAPTEDSNVNGTSPMWCFEIKGP